MCFSQNYNDDEMFGISKVFTFVIIFSDTYCSAFTITISNSNTHSIRSFLSRNPYYNGRKLSSMNNKNKNWMMMMMMISSNNNNNKNEELLSLPARPGRPLKVIIAGDGVGGLTAALCMLKKGFQVKVDEKMAVFARLGGPI